MVLVSSPDQLEFYKECLAIARQEYEDTVKNDVQKAISVLMNLQYKLLCANYIDNVKGLYSKRKN
jgi:serine protein kinase